MRILLILVIALGTLPARAQAPAPAPPRLTVLTPQTPSEPVRARQAIESALESSGAVVVPESAYEKTREGIPGSGPELLRKTAQTLALDGVVTVRIAPKGLINQYEARFQVVAPDATVLWSGAVPLRAAIPDQTEARTIAVLAIESARRQTARPEQLAAPPAEQRPPAQSPSPEPYVPPEPASGGGIPGSPPPATPPAKPFNILPE